MEEKQKQVYRILCMPIRCTGRNGSGKKIFVDSGIIKSTQTYRSSLDQDMSDFACGFYEIIYRDILNQTKIVDDTSGKLNNNAFAGDTMNSFNTIANRFPEAGKSRCARRPQSEWPKILQEYYNFYHCLANFWLLPLQIGRKCNGGELVKASRSNQDYMDRFLNNVLEKRNRIEYIFGEYSVKDFGDFASKHFLIGSYTDENLNIFRFSEKSSTPENVIREMMMRIESRAYLLANSEYSDYIYDYFRRLGLTK